MTPAQLDVLMAVHVYVNSDEAGKPQPSTNPAADLAALAAL